VKFMLSHCLFYYPDFRPYQGSVFLQLVELILNSQIEPSENT
jgi:hypothetical protein